MANPVKKTSKPRKKRGKVKIKQGVQIRKKTAENAPKDTLPKAPTKTTLPDNGVRFKVKIRKR